MNVHLLVVLLVIGGLLMVMLGIIGEYLARRDHQRAVRVGVATWLGILAGLVAKVVIAFMMVGIFVVALAYVLVVYAAPFLSWNGAWSLLEQHAFLVPAPLMAL